MTDRLGKPIEHGRAVVAVGVAVMFVLVVFWASPPARADEGPQIVSGPKIAGMTQEGQTLTATATYSGIPTPRASWTWLRCTRKGASSCTAIPDATESSYLLTAADVAYRIRVRLTVRNSVGVDDALSGATHVVTATPTLTATATPTPTATAPSTSTPGRVMTSTRPSPTWDGLPPTTSAGAVLRTQAPPPVLRPFPVVRIRGRFTPKGVYVNLLTIRAPRGVRIVIRCAGRGCFPARRWAQAAALTRVHRFERALPAGVRLTVQVTRPGWIGKHTRLLIRRGRPPSRVDRCLYPGRTRPRACPRATPSAG
jgi:hypothetical protein